MNPAPLKRVLLVAGLAAALALGVFGVVSAHAKIDHCTPDGGATVATAPAQVVCVMTEEIDTKLSTLSVTDANGASVDKKDAHVDLDDPDRKTLVVSLDSTLIKDGIYSVKWHVVTPDDNATSDGTFQFIVGSAAVTPHPTTQILQGESSGTPGAETTGTPAASETITATVGVVVTPMETVAATTPATTPTPSAGATGNTAAASYCTDNGGKVTTRYPTYGTNLPPPQWLRLASPRDFCTFLAPPDESGFQSHIEIALDTLYSAQPTLAMLAYLEPLALPPFTGANPSTLYCNKLGGSDIWGGMDNAAGGGWVTEAPDSADNFQVVGMCVFPDLSAIDSWGLAYKANGIVRGTDLSKVARYQPTSLPSVFIGGESKNQPGAGTVDKTVTNADNGSQVNLKVGDTLSVQLTSNPSTGFSWQVVSTDDKVLQAVGEPQFSLPAGSTARPGAPGTQTFTLNAVGKGQTALTLVYVRPWEKNVTPTPPNTFTVQVTVE